MKWTFFLFCLLNLGTAFAFDFNNVLSLLSDQSLNLSETKYQCSDQSLAQSESSFNHLLNSCVVKLCGPASERKETTAITQDKILDVKEQDEVDYILNSTKDDLNRFINELVKKRTNLFKKVSDLPSNEISFNSTNWSDEDYLNLYRAISGSSQNSCNDGCKEKVKKDLIGIKLNDLIKDQAIKNNSEHLQSLIHGAYKSHVVQKVLEKRKLQTPVDLISRSKEKIFLFIKKIDLKSLPETQEFINSLTINPAPYENLPKEEIVDLQRYFIGSALKRINNNEGSTASSPWLLEQLIKMESDPFFEVPFSKTAKMIGEEFAYAGQIRRGIKIKENTVYFSEVACNNKEAGESVLIHEMAHALGYFLKTNHLDKDLNNQYLQYRKCATSFYKKAQKKSIFPNEMNYENDNFFTEEDTADLIAFQALKESPELSMCSLLGMSYSKTSYNELNLTPFGTHNSPALRLLKEATLKSNLKMPNECVQVIDALKDEYNFAKCPI